MNQNKIPRRLLSLKIFVASVVLASTPLSAEEPNPESTVVIGSEVSLSSVNKAEWLKGEGPKSFEPGKVYIFECWATWCGPCIAMIPHVNELHKKYYDKGLRVYGMSVWEDDKEKVKKFVEKKGDKMSYPVAFTGNGAAFETEWLTAAGAKSIPHAFIVRNGKLVGSTQASRLTDSLIESLLSGDEGTKKATDTLLASQDNQEKTERMVLDMNIARKAKDVEKMTALLNELKALDPAHSEIHMQELWILIVSKDWSAAVKALNEMPVSEPKTTFISIKGLTLARSDHHDYPADFMKAFVKLYSDYVLLNEISIGPNHFACLSIHQWRLGDKQSAVITADKGVEAAKISSKNSEAKTKAFVRFAKSVNEGTMPKFTDLSKWQREAMKETPDAK